MPRIFITGSTDGLGRAAAGFLISEGHDVVLHARSRERAAALSDLAADAAGVVIGDLSSAAETRDLADQVNQIGRMDAVIHNAGVFLEPSRSPTADGHTKTTWLAVSNDAAATVSGGYWYHRQRQAPAPQARDPAFQDLLMDQLAALTGVALF